MGVGSIVINDPDIVEEKNLPRQTLYNEDDLGLYKVDAAIKNLKAKNKNINIISYKEIINCKYELEK